MPLHRGMPTLAAKAVLSRPSFPPEPMLTYRTEVREAHWALELDVAYCREQNRGLIFKLPYLIKKGKSDRSQSSFFVGIESIRS